jgi:hypothetical protein
VRAKRAPRERCSEPAREDNQQSSPLTGESGGLAQFNAENVVRLFQERVANNDAA